MFEHWNGQEPRRVTEEELHHIYQLGEEMPRDRWYVRDFAEKGHYRYAICGPSGEQEAWTPYAETAQRIVRALNATSTVSPPIAR